MGRKSGMSKTLHLGGLVINIKRRHNRSIASLYRRRRGESRQEMECTSRRTRPLEGCWGEEKGRVDDQAALRRRAFFSILSSLLFRMPNPFSKRVSTSSRERPSGSG